MCWPWRKKKRPDISLIVPFRDDGEHRTRVWRWLKQYWEANLPNAEIVMGTDDGPVFCKSAAINSAARRAKGKVFVILDADAYMDAEQLNEVCQHVIRQTEAGKRTWAVPYESIWYLSESATKELLKLSAREPYLFPSPPPREVLEKADPLYGHQYGAMCVVMPREAFTCINGWDERFVGWGFEDACALWSCDVLWGLHEVFSHDMTHLWHIRIGSTGETRRWPGQPAYGPANSRLGHRYNQASGEPSWMQALADEHPL